jgi:hypothetical protein
MADQDWKILVKHGGHNLTLAADAALVADIYIGIWIRYRARTTGLTMFQSQLASFRAALGAGGKFVRMRYGLSEWFEEAD